MVRGSESDKMRGVINGRRSLLVGLRLSSLALEIFMAVTEAYVFGVIGIEEAVCRKVARQAIDLDNKYYRAFDRALGYTTYGLRRLGLGSIDAFLRILINLGSVFFRPTDRMLVGVISFFL